MSKTPRPNTLVYQLKVTLLDVEPPIWRRILVPSDTRLSDLHLMLQAAMGWSNGHLHRFTIGDVDYMASDQGFEDEPDVQDELRVRLDKVVREPKTRFGYLYDFGDGWEHEIVVEAIGKPEPGKRYPVCTGGQRACPPEDCGGSMGYEEFLTVIANPRHKEHAEMMEWAGGSFDPEAFDLDSINGFLADYKLFDWQAED